MLNDSHSGGRPKGQPKLGGRTKGTPNKNTRLVKDVFATVFSELQSDPNYSLKRWAKKNPTEFYKIAARLIPTQVTGDPENPIIIENHTIEL